MVLFVFSYITRKEDIWENEMNPWETPEGKLVWKTEAQYWTWLRGSMRRIWSDYPVRKVWKASKLRKVTDEERAKKVYHPSTKNVGQCVYCNEWMAGSKLEVDHINPSNGCTDKENAESFLWYCGGGTGDDWCLACKPCHKIVTHAERKGITIEEARVEKEAIPICKLSSKEQNDYIEKNGGSTNTNPKLRRAEIERIIRNRRRGEQRE